MISGSNLRGAIHGAEIITQSSQGILLSYSRKVTKGTRAVKIPYLTGSFLYSFQEPTPAEQVFVIGQ